VVKIKEFAITILAERVQRYVSNSEAGHLMKAFISEQCSHDS